MILGWLQRLLGIGSVPDLRDLKLEGVAVIDVRSKEEFHQGHLPGSQNIPLNVLSTHFARWKKDQPIILCCASGVRSGQAVSSMHANGFTRVYNGGSWRSLRSRWQSTGGGTPKHI